MTETPDKVENDTWFVINLIDLLHRSFIDEARRLPGRINRFDSLPNQFRAKFTQLTGGSAVLV